MGLIAITVPATDKTLLSIDEMRLAAGLDQGDQSKDTALRTLNAQLSRVITSTCRVRSDGVNEPTLRRETIAETYRLSECMAGLFLSRPLAPAIVSITEDGTAVDAADYELDAVCGIVRRLDNDEYDEWEAAKVIVTYQAGFSVVPSDLKLAMQKLVSSITASEGRDPSLKRLKVDGVSEHEWWVGPVSDPIIPQEVMDLLAPYRKILV